MVKNKGQARGITLTYLLGFILILVGLVLPAQVQAADYSKMYSGDYDVKYPVTWHQGSAPYSGDAWEYCTAGTYGPCSCGVHAVASMLLKTGYWGEGKTAVDGTSFASQHNVLSTCIAKTSDGICLKKDEASQYDANNLPSHLQKGPIYNYDQMDAATGGYMTFKEDFYNNTKYLTDYESILRDAYKNGYFAIIAVDLAGPGEGHAIIMDYIDEEGEIVIIDSGGRYKYLEGMYGVSRIILFEVDGLKSYDAPKLWLKESLFPEGHADGADNSVDDSGGDTNAGDSSSDNNSNMRGELEDPFTWLDNPIVYYDEDESIKDGTSKNKGLSNNKKTGWLDRLFN